MIADGRTDGEVAVKFEVLSDEESVVDDPCAVGNKEVRSFRLVI